MKSIRWLAALGLLLLAATPAAAQFSTITTPTGSIVAGPYVIIDAATGETLLQNNAGAAWYPASLTKLMTIYLTFEQLKAGRLTLASRVVFSAHAAGMPESKLGVGVGGSITVDQALQALVVHSANDVATALAEAIGGSEPAFGQLMTQTAQRLGMTATQFTNANGLPDPGNVTSARDLTLLALALMRDFPQYYGYFLAHDFVFGKRRFVSYVHFVEMYAPYADGLKTGFICNSGFNVVGSAVRDGRRLIGVAFGFRRADLRDEFLVRLFDEAYALKTGGNRPKVWQIRNEGGEPARVFGPGECGVPSYDMPGDAAWLGNYASWAAARHAFDVGQADLTTLGVTRLGKEWILPITANKVTHQAAIIADLEPDAAQKLCAAYKAKKAFCEVHKATEITPPFNVFRR
ncbi:MAG TPA: D-alanyl-D-alanine carboxypeptidase family protein [Reyranella sp.]|nr:D-alanyl-D-alanine carboxypeptidase family protein [Reyranella sp.]